MAARRKHNLNFLPGQQPAAPIFDVNGLPLDISVGELLRMHRERNGQELQTVANQLRVRLVYLEAIEDGRFKELPGTTYAVGFLRSYADYLGLDSADVVRRFREEVARAHGQPRLIFPNIAADGKIPGTALLLLSVLGAAVVYGAWYYIASRQAVDLPLIAEVPDRLVALPPGEADEEDLSAPPPPANEPATMPPGASGENALGAPPSAAIGQPADVSAPADPAAASAPAGPTDVAPSSPATGNSSQDGGALADASPAPSVAAPSAAEDATLALTPTTIPVTSPEFIPPAPPVPPAMSAPPAPAAVAAAPEQLGPRILIEARIDSWIEVLDAEGKTITAQVLRAGESFAPPDQAGMTLTTGNAGGLDVIVDGAKVPSLGEIGSVKRKIPLEPEKLKAGQAVSE